MINIGYGFSNALAGEPAFVTVTQFQCLCAVVKTHVHLDCRIPARIQNFSGLNVPDAGARHTLPRRLDQFSPDEANPFTQIA